MTVLELGMTVLDDRLFLARATSTKKNPVNCHVVRLEAMRRLLEKAMGTHAGPDFYLFCRRSYRSVFLAREVVVRKVTTSR
jgi:hypothetical protein